MWGRLALAREALRRWSFGAFSRRDADAGAFTGVRGLRRGAATKICFGDGRLAVLFCGDAAFVANPAGGVVEHVTAFAAQHSVALFEGAVANGTEALIRHEGTLPASGSMQPQFLIFKQRRTAGHRVRA